MSKTYIIIALVLIVLSGGLLLLPESERTRELAPERLHREILDPARYVSVDYVAERLINEDPAIMLVDVRQPDQAEAYALPLAVRIPLHEIAWPEWENYLNQRDMDVILYSNGDLFSDQAWILCKRLGYENVFVMSGGLNQWFADIIQPVPPPETAPSEAFDLYAFRMAASIYFRGGQDETAGGSSKTESVKIMKREKKTVTGGGC